MILWVTSLRPGRNLTINGKFYDAIDGYMIAGPQFTNYMLSVAPAYGTNPFQAPPSNLTRHCRPAAQQHAGAVQRRTSPARPTGNGNNGNGNNGNGNNDKD